MRTCTKHLLYPVATLHFHISLKMEPPASSYVCDTRPAPRLASVQPQSVRLPSAFELEVTEQVKMDEVKMDEVESLAESSEEQNAPPARKLCVRHQRMADEGTNLKLQQVSLPPISARASRSTSSFFGTSYPLIIFFSVPGCTPRPRTRGRQCYLVKFFFLLPSPPRLDTPRLAHHVLFLPAIFTHRTPGTAHSDRLFHRLS